MRITGRCTLRLLAGLVLLCLLSGTPGVRAQTPAAPTSPLLSASEYAYPPFAIVDAAGQAGGFSVELLRAAVNAMGREVTFRVGRWDQVRQWLETGEVQALPLVGRTPEREALYDFTFPYMTMHGAIVVRADRPDVRTLDDLAGGTVAVMAGDNAEEFLRREPRAFEIHTTATFEEALQRLSDGEFDAVVIQRLVALRLIDSAGLPNLRVVENPVTGFEQDLCFAVQEGDSETLALLNEGLALVMADGTFRRLHARWLGNLGLPAPGRLVAGGDDNYPPYEYLDENGQPAGFNVELTRAIAQELGLDVEFRLGPWSEIRDGLINGDIDLAMGMFYSPERDAVFEFSSPYAVIEHVAVSRADSPRKLSAFGDLVGLRVVTMQGDIMHDLAIQNGLSDELTLVSSQEDALRMVVDGAADVALVARVPAKYWIEQNGWEGLQVARVPLASFEYGYAAAEGRSDVLAQFEEGLQIVEDTGEYRRIRARWLEAYEGARIERSTVLRYAGMVLAPLGLILLGTFVWSRSLSRQVARRTEELRRSEEQFGAMIEGAPDPVFVQVDLRVVYANAATARLMSVSTAAELVGRPVLDFVPVASREAIIDGLRRLDESRTPVPRMETTLVTPDGHEIDVELSAVPFLFAGEPGALVFAQDISERKQIEEARRETDRRLAVLMANLPGMAYRCRNAPGWQMDFVSEGCLALTGYSSEELVSGKITNYERTIHPEDRAMVWDAIQEAVTRGAPFRINYRIVTRQGRERHVFEQGRLVSESVDAQKWLEGYITDITEKELADREVARQLDELRRWQMVMLAREERVRALKRQINDLSTRLGEAPPFTSQAG